MRLRIIGTLLAFVIISVGAIALPTRAAVEKAVANEKDNPDPVSERDPASPPLTDPNALVLLSAPQWTVEKLSRHFEFPQLDRRVICPYALPLDHQLERKLFRHDLNNIRRALNLLAQPIRIYLVGANAPPLS